MNNEDQIKYHMNNANVYLMAAADELSKAIALTYGGSVGGGDHIAAPWIGQNVREIDSDDYAGNDCGTACLAMWLGYRGQSVTVDQVSKATGLSRGFSYTLPAHLITAAGAFGLTLRRQFNITLDLIKLFINTGEPLIVLVHYGSMPKRFSDTFRAGHWILVTGVGDDYVIYNDPLAQDLSGQSIKAPWSDFAQAMDDCKIDGNIARQGLVQA